MKKSKKPKVIPDKQQEWRLIGTYDAGSGTQTWAFDIPGCGCLVRVTQTKGRQFAESMVFAPNVNVVKEGEGEGAYRLVCLRPYETQITFTSANAANRIKWSDTSKLDKKLAKLDKDKKDTGVSISVGHSTDET